MDSEYLLVNAYDELVKANVREMMETQDVCRCEKCFLDVCALVFNRGYSHFVTTKAGELFIKMPEMKYSGQAAMTVAILDAIKMVHEQPKHD